ncbi:hypothetical protein [Streptomyces sp. NBC_00259]|nr:hypothetical protein [Streptomyces sp. NBC_00259]
MPIMVAEIRVPLLPTLDLLDGSYSFPWIEEAEEFGLGPRVTLPLPAV